MLGRLRAWGTGPTVRSPTPGPCQAVWLYLHDPQLRAGIEALQAQRAQAQAAYWRQQDRDRQRCAGLARFIDHWWLGRSGPPHWATRGADSANELAVVFTGTTLRGLELLATYAHCFRRKSEVPVGLKPAGWFHRAAWYQRELQATAAFVGRRQAYPLCPVSEQARLDVKFRLRLVSVTATPTEALATQTELQKMGYSPSQIEALRPRGRTVQPDGPLLVSRLSGAAAGPPQLKGERDKKSCPISYLLFSGII